MEEWGRNVRGKNEEKKKAKDKEDRVVSKLSLQALTLAGALMVLVLNEYDPLITPMTMSFGLSPLISF